MNFVQHKAVALLICLIASHCIGVSLQAQMQEDSTVRSAISVLNEIMMVPASSIPQGMLYEAHAVAIIPNVLKGGFVIGARHGKGVLLVRDQTGGWHAPVFINLTGGNIGWQAGVQTSDVVLVFKTAKSVNGLLSGKFTLGADAAVAAGPVGRQAAAATDASLGAEIYSWSRSRGLFLGVSFDGSVIEMDQLANANYYRRATPDGPVIVPEAAQQLTMQVGQYTGVNRNTGIAAQNVSAQPRTDQPIYTTHSRQETIHVRDELARFARELYRKLDPAWQSYLGLPAEVFNGNGHADIAALNTSLSHFQTVMADPRYAALAGDAEFQSTYGLLLHYIQDLAQQSSAVQLPPPPMDR
jgi:lipid-binding SYLF domain-containing protein